VLSHADNRLALHLPLEAEGYACTTDDLLMALLGVLPSRAQLNRSVPASSARQIGPRARCDVRTGNASALRAAIAVLAKRGDGRSRPPPPTAYLALALSFMLLNIYVHICWLDTPGKALVHREWKESLAASGELVIHFTMIVTINYKIIDKEILSWTS
jgi:hypothetical protein